MTDRFYYHRMLVSGEIAIRDRTKPFNRDMAAKCWDTDIAERIVEALNRANDLTSARVTHRNLCVTRSRT